MSSSISVASIPRQRPKPKKRIIFDRRYGWLYDEWNDPLEAALSGGRGMFCILPLAKALTNTTCRSINFAMESALQMVEKRDFGFSFELFKTGVDDQFQKFKASMKRNNFNLLTMRKENVDLGSHWKEKV
ncbi:uncharacterized protein LOC18427728 isoform X2 [Amborella trichopoda]|uniref:Uncharacterized protein n=1 Tax=Amborella trichopoda TaxID=13333 RepID=W1NWQ1_AMBTC|nr:uncharacterized protein LOC18427728 isoform X2 [Amborella trichopoda]ERM99690.1 hypothetical protein AMTR_s00099p00065170 [Amborella trichopoda]|eukprot:XP_006836837.1 uncharacterized protein LOC18427728 isoform X2 [Amborella trichopoda]